MKKKLCLFLAVLFMLSAVLGLTSCNKDGGEGSEGETTVSTTGGDANGDKEKDKLYSKLSTGDFGGYEFKILNAQSNYALTDIVPVDSPDSLSQAMIERNSVVKTKLNINIIEDSRPYPSYNVVQDEVRKFNSAQTFEFDAVFNECAAQTPLAQEGAYLATEDYEVYLDLSKPWWFGDAMDSLKIDGRTCELFGDFHLMYYESINGMTFNQKMFTENKVEFPYDLVREGKWTMAEFKEMATIFSENETGADCYGVVAPKSFASALITSSNFFLVEQDEEKVLRVYDNDDILVQIYTDILTFYSSNGDEGSNWIHPDYSAETFKSGAFKVGKSIGGHGELFASGRAAFMNEATGAIRAMRRCEFNYGIIPLPKYNTDQDKYVSFIYSGAASCGVPVTSPNLERTCTVLENLAAFSHKYIKDEYYEVVVQLRTVRDNDSIEMLDIMFGHSDLSTTKFELDTIFHFGITGCLRINISDKNSGIKSQLDSIKLTEVPTNIQKVIDGYKKKAN